MELLQQFFAQTPVPVEHVSVVELICPERSSLRGDLSRSAHHGRNQLRCDALRARDQLDIGAERLHRPEFLAGKGIGGHDPQRIAFHRTDEGQRRAGAASAVFHDKLTRP